MGDEMFSLVENFPQNAVIKVIGVGGGGGNAVRHMVDNQIADVEFICANTDAQALKDLTNTTMLKIGGGVTKGLGAGANPEVGRQAALEDRERIAEVLRGADMVFITAGMGGGTGTGAAPVVAQIAREMGILTVGVVTKPFPFEGKKRMAVAAQGLKELADNVDSLITIPNEKLLTALDKNTSLLNAFKAANNVLLDAVKGISELIMNDESLINVDFADVRTVMSEMGIAMMGSGTASGEDRARLAAEAAISCPLLENVDLHGARGILVNITSGYDFSMGEFEVVGDTIDQFASENATVVIGTVIDPELDGEVRVTVVATGLGQLQAQQEAVKPVMRTVVDNSAQMSLNTQPNYADLDVPPALRNKSYASASTSGSVSQPASAPQDELDYLDIPAFLRRQAD